MSSSKPARGADLLVNTLTQLGVERIYTLSGNHIMSIFDACLGSGLQLVHTRHEAACVHMADAQGRLSGSPSVAMVTGGPGHANAIGALYTALMAESPMVLLSGQSPVNQEGKGAFQEIDQVALAAPVVKAAWSIRDRACIEADVRLAFQIAGSGRPGPVSLSLPSDVMEELAVAQKSVPSAAAQAFVSVEPARQQTDQVCNQALKWLGGGVRPLILAGPMMLLGERRARFASLEQRFGIPVVAMDSPRGVDDPRLGAFAAQLSMADRVLLLGKRADFTIKFGSAPSFAAECRFIQLESDPAELVRAKANLGERLVEQHRADPALCLQALESVGFDGLQFSAWHEAVASACIARPAAWASIPASRPAPLHPVQIGRVINELFGKFPKAVLVSDGGEFGQWVQACVDPARRLINGPAGAIGVALPMGLAARAVEREAPVIALMGDGAYGFHPMEFDTAARSGLPFVVIIGNDRRWNAEYQIQLKQYGANRLLGCELADPAYEQIASAMGGNGMRINTEEQLRAALTQAIASNQPYCLNVEMEGLAAPNLKQ